MNRSKNVANGTAAERALAVLHAGFSVQRISPTHDNSPINDEIVVDVVRRVADRLFFVEMSLAGLADKADGSCVEPVELSLLEDEVSRLGRALVAIGGSR